MLFDLDREVIFLSGNRLARGTMAEVLGPVLGDTIIGEAVPEVLAAAEERLASRHRDQLELRERVHQGNLAMLRESAALLERPAQPVPAEGEAQATSAPGEA